MATQATNVVDYIVQRLADEGIAHCFGVPGDYAFPVNDAVDRRRVTFLFTDIEGSTTLLQPRNSGWVLRSNALSLNSE